jgi:hypothetical protein
MALLQHLPRTNSSKSSCNTSNVPAMT